MEPDNSTPTDFVTGCASPDPAVSLARAVWEMGIRDSGDVEAFLGIFRRCAEILQSLPWYRADHASHPGTVVPLPDPLPAGVTPPTTPDGPTEA